MSTKPDASALLDRVIARVEALDVSGSPLTEPAPAPATATATATATAAKASPSRDYAWKPRVPPGHTSYSWTGETGPGFQNPIDRKPAKDTAAAAAVQQQQQQQQQRGSKAASGDQLSPDLQNFSALDFRVGKIVAVKRHPDADSLYIEQIDIGESAGPREIISGLVKFVPEDAMLNARVLVFANLKPNKLRGVLSHGMVLCAKNAEGTKVEFVSPPANASLGDRVLLKGFEAQLQSVNVEPTINLKKKTNAWAPCMPLLATNGDGVACFNGIPLCTSDGTCTAKTLSNAQIA